MIIRLIKIEKCNHCGFPKKVFHMENVGYFSDCKDGCKIKKQEDATRFMKIEAWFYAFRKGVRL